MSRASPFAASVHLLAGAILRPLKPGEAGILGDRMAAIDPWRRLNSPAAGLSVYLERRDPALKRYALVADECLAGVLTLRSPWLRGPFVEILAIVPEAQGLGLGRKTVEWVATQSAALSSNLWASVSDFNQDARSFWAKTGFSEIAPLPDLVAPGFADILLRRRLR